MFRYLCEEVDDIFAEKHFLPAVRNLATKLILSGEKRFELISNLCRLPQLYFNDCFLYFAGELDTYEALSSDLQKNVLSALRRLEALTKLEWVMKSVNFSAYFYLLAEKLSVIDATH